MQFLPLNSLFSVEDAFFSILFSIFVIYKGENNLTGNLRHEGF